MVILSNTDMPATNEKKIAIRKAPIDKANTYDEGYISKGSDDMMYVVKSDKKGIKRWQKMKPMEEHEHEEHEKPDERERDPDERERESEEERERKREEERSREEEREEEREPNEREPEEEREPEKKPEPKKKEKKAKKEKKERSPRTLTTYNKFVRANMQEVRNSNETPLKPNDCMKALGAMWKAMTIEEKDAFAATVA